MTLAAWPTYDSYRDDVAPWLGKVPATWPFEKAKWFLTHRKQLNSEGKIDNVLSLTLRGVVNNDPENPEGLVPKDYRTYQIFDADNLVFKLIDLENVRTSRVGLVHEQGIMSSAYIRLVVPQGWNARFLHYYYFHLYEAEVFNKIGSGVRSTLGQSDLLELPIPIIDRSTQDKIVHLLDEKCAKVDEAVRIKEEQIALLRERRQILIQQAVTRGLNPAAPMKDSGIDWIGQIPAHWETKKLKYAAEIFRGKFTHRPRNDPRLYDGAYPFFQTGDVARAGMFLSDFKQTLNEKGLRVSTLIPRGTILLTIAANIGDVAVLDIDACFPDSVVGFKPSKIFDRDFLYFAMSSMKRVFLDSSVANAQANLNVDRIGAISLCRPPAEEQTQIVRYINQANRKTEDAIAIKEEQIAALKEYKTSLINAAVTGKIKVA